MRFSGRLFTRASLPRLTRLAPQELRQQTAARDADLAAQERKRQQDADEFRALEREKKDQAPLPKGILVVFTLP